MSEEPPIPVDFPEAKSVDASGTDIRTQEVAEKLPGHDPFLVQFDKDDPTDPHVRYYHPSRI